MFASSKTKNISNENYVFDFKKYTNIGKDKGIYTCSFYESEFCRGS